MKGRYSMNNSFKRVVNQSRRSRMQKEQEMKKKVLAGALAVSIVTMGLAVTSKMYDDWVHNTKYCELTGKEVTDNFGEYLFGNVKTNTTDFELYGNVYTFGSIDEKMELEKAAILNQHETNGIDNPESFCEENYEDYLAYVGEVLEDGQRVDGSEYLDYMFKEHTKGVK